MAADICRVDNRVCVCPDIPQTETESARLGRGGTLFFGSWEIGKLQIT